MINNNLHFGPHLGLTVNRDTILVVRQQISHSDIDTLLDLLFDNDSRVVIASEQLLAELGEDAYRQLIARLKSTDPLAHPDKRQALQKAFDHFHQINPDLSTAEDVSFPPSKINPTIDREHDGQQLSKPYSPDSQGLLGIDENAYDLSTATGGIYYFWAPGEFGTAPGALVMFGRKLSYIFGNSAESPVDYKTPLIIPVKAGTKKLYVFTGAQKIEHVRLITPSGQAVEDTTLKMKLYPLKHMFIAHIDNPEPGHWQLKFSGKGKYIISAQGN